LEQIIQEDYVRGVPEIYRDGAARLAGDNDLEKLGRRREIG